MESMILRVSPRTTLSPWPACLHVLGMTLPHGTQIHDRDGTDAASGRAFSPMRCHVPG